MLTKEELTIFKNVYEDRHFFVLTGYIKDNKIYYDSKSKDSVIKINPINTNFLICPNYRELNIDNLVCDNVAKIDVIDIDTINASRLFIPNSLNSLHQFSTYTNFYFS